MAVNTAFRAFIISACLANCGCHSDLGRDRSAPFRIIATDAGFEAPDVVPAGMRHIVFENRGSEIHEAMLVKLPDGMSTKDYVAAGKAGLLFSKSAQDHFGPGLTSPRETGEGGAEVEPGKYLITCLDKGQA